MDIMKGLAAISQALGIIKTLQDINAQTNVAEYRLNLADVASSLADAKLALLQAGEEVRALQEEIIRLKRDAARMEALNDDNDFHYR
jgi:hypothetical protein